LCDDAGGGIAAASAAHTVGDDQNRVQRLVDLPAGQDGVTVFVDLAHSADVGSKANIDLHGHSLGLQVAANQPQEHDQKQGENAE